MVQDSNRKQDNLICADSSFRLKRMAVDILLKFPILVKLSLAMDVLCRAVHIKFQAGTASKLKRLNAYQNHITAPNKHRAQ